MKDISKYLLAWPDFFGNTLPPPPKPKEQDYIDRWGAERRALLSKIDLSELEYPSGINSEIKAECIRLHQAGVSNRAIGRKLGISHPTVGAIIKGHGK